MHSFLCPLLSVRLTSSHSPRAFNVSFKYTSSALGAITPDTISHHALSLPSFSQSGRRVKSILPFLCAPAIACKVEWQECSQKRKRAEGREGGPWQAMEAVKKHLAQQGGHVKVNTSNSYAGRLGSDIIQVI